MFKKGQSGNPKGRPPGSGVSGELRKKILVGIPEIIESLMQRAKEGDVAAAKLLLDRVLPPIKSQSQPVSIPVGTDIESTGWNIIQSTLNGELSPDIGSQLIRSLADQGRVVEMEKLTAQLERLSKLLASR